MIKNLKEGYAKFYHLTIKNIANIVSEVLECHEFKINFCLFFIFLHLWVKLGLFSFFQSLLKVQPRSARSTTKIYEKKVWNGLVVSLKTVKVPLLSIVDNNKFSHYLDLADLLQF